MLFVEEFVVNCVDYFGFVEKDEYLDGDLWRIFKDF